MAITVVGSPASTSGGGGASLTLASFVVGATSDLLLVAVGSAATGTRTVSGVTFGGVALTNLATTGDDGVWDHIEIWYLKNPSVSTANIVATYTASVDARAIGAIALTGTHASAYLNTPAGNSGTTGATASVTVNSAVGEFVVAAIMSDSESGITEGGTLQFEIENIGGDNSFGCESYAGASPTVAAQWAQTIATTNWACVGVSIKPAGAAGVVPTPGVGALTLAGTTNVPYKAPTPPSGALALSGQAPTLTIGGSGTNTNASPAVAALALTGHTPALTGVVYPLVGSLVLAGQNAASAFQGPDEGGLVFSGNTPTLRFDIGRATGTGAVVWGGPTLTVGISHSRAVPVGTLAWAGPAATLSSSASPAIAGSLGTLVFTGQSISAATPLAYQVPSGALTFGRPAPLSLPQASRRGKQKRGRGRAR